MAARRTHTLSAVAHERIRAASVSGCALRAGPTRNKGMADFMYACWPFARSGSPEASSARHTTSTTSRRTVPIGSGEDRLGADRILLGAVGTTRAKNLLSTGVWIMFVQASRVRYGVDRETRVVLPRLCTRCDGVVHRLSPGCAQAVVEPTGQRSYRDPLTPSCCAGDGRWWPFVGSVRPKWCAVSDLVAGSVSKGLACRSRS